MFNTNEIISRCRQLISVAGSVAVGRCRCRKTLVYPAGMVRIVDIDSLLATTATLGDRDQYAVAYATFPAWRGACLVLGIAVPVRNELDRAKAVRDRFAVDVLPSVQVMTAEEPKERY